MTNAAIDTTFDPFGISMIDGEKGFVYFNCGWRSPILNMLDEDGDDTDDQGEAVVLVLKVPDGYMTIDLRTLLDDADDDEEFMH